MPDESLERLTEPQREVLRLVAQGFESKDIARQLNVSHHSVNRRIERAISTLDVRNRKEAARRLIVAEGGTYEPLPREPIPLVSIEEPGKSEPPAAGGTNGFPWPFATPNSNAGLTVRQRLFWALVGIPVIIMLAFGLFLSGINALAHLNL